MNAVVYYSNTGYSREIARYLAKRLGFALLDIQHTSETAFDSLVLVFPVHCQNIPHAVKAFLRVAKAQNLTAVATYGRMCHGNVLREIQRGYGMRIVAGAYVPTAHSYLGDEPFADYERLEPLVQKIRHPTEIRLPRCYKNPFANLLPHLRSCMGVKLYKTDACISCGICDASCSAHAIKNGVPDRSCIRCLGCIAACPHGALRCKLRLPMRLYLQKKQQNNIEIYI